MFGEHFQNSFFQNNNENGDCDGDNIFDGDGTWGWNYIKNLKPFLYNFKSFEINCLLKIQKKFPLKTNITCVLKNLPP